MIALQFKHYKTIKIQTINNTLNIFIIDGKMQNYEGNTLMTSNESSQLQLFISARGLFDMDVFSKSDPYVRVHYKNPLTQKWSLVGRTETIDNNLNPNFKKSFIFDYIFETQQHLKFQVMDQDDKVDSKNDDFIGSIQTTLGACAGAREQTSILNLANQNKNNNVGKLIIRVEPVNDNNNFLRLKWCARKLMNTDSWFDWWDKSDPYLKFLKIRKDNTLIDVGRTNVVMDNLDPNWPLIEISLSKLLKTASFQQKFKIQCWDWQQAGQAKHQFIGQIYLTVTDLIGGSKKPIQFTLTNPKHNKPGTLILQFAQIYQKPSFISYLQGGLQLNLSVAIDFTGSNGTPTHSSSLHYFNQYQPNQYQKAIIGISNILLNYDYDKRIPAFGFGAKLNFPMMSTMNVSHCFPLSGNNQEIQAMGIEGLMGMYQNALTNVSLSGPTFFAPIIKQFIDIAYRAHNDSILTYQILFILTDGQIHDMDQTVDLLVNNSHLPLSIIIVGIGNANFQNMNTLDGDNGLYNSKGTKALRDIVQFVPFNQVSMNPDLLAKQLLAELPSQVVEYMTINKKVPVKPAEVNINHIMMEGQNAEGIEAQLKKNLPGMFAGLTVTETH